MSKSLTPGDLAHILSRLLVGDEIDDQDVFEKFVTDAAKLVANYCGGVSSTAYTEAGSTVVVVRHNESLPSDGGIYKDYDPEGDIWNGLVQPEASAKPLRNIVLSQNEDMKPFLDMAWQIYFPDLIEQKYDDYDLCPEWLFLTENAAFTHAKVADLLVHVVTVHEHSPNVPETIKQTIATAHAAGVTWILFHLGQ